MQIKKEINDLFLYIFHKIWSCEAFKPRSWWEIKFDRPRRESRFPPTSVVSFASHYHELDCWVWLHLKKKGKKRCNLSPTNHLHGLLILSSARRGRAVDAAEEDDILGDLKMAPRRGGEWADPWPFISSAFLTQCVSGFSQVSLQTSDPTLETLVVLLLREAGSSDGEPTPTCSLRRRQHLAFISGRLADRRPSVEAPNQLFQHFPFCRLLI